MVIQATQARLTETARKALKVREEHCPDPWLSGSSRSAVSGSAPIDSIPQVMSQFGLPLKNRLRSARLSSPTIAVSACSLWSQAASGRVRGRRSGVAWRKVDIFKGLLQKIGFVRRGSIPLFFSFFRRFQRSDAAKLVQQVGRRMFDETRGYFEDAEKTRIEKIDEEPRPFQKKDHRQSIILNVKMHKCRRYYVYLSCINQRRDFLANCQRASAERARRFRRKYTTSFRNFSRFRKIFSIGPERHFYSSILCNHH